NLAGKWELTYETQRGTTTWQLNFEMKDGVLAGTATNQRGEMPISKVSVKGEDIAFTITVTFNDNSFEQNFTGKVTGDTGEGTLAAMGRRGGGGQPINWKMKRAM
ncbi:MAG: hypothetical protein L0271_10745, partial [Gemmatimonadetes bacterium]|nr:hypothetical protein [Gemmatimonadota bacterium]